MAFEFEQATKGIYRGSQPVTKEAYKIILDHGVETIIKLNKEHAAFERSWAFKKRIDLYEIILSEYWSPDPNILRHIAMSLKDCGKSVFIHCLHGHDRTGYAVAAYRMLVQGWTFEQAYDECKREGHKWLFYFWWPKALKKLEKC